MASVDVHLGRLARYLIEGPTATGGAPPLDSLRWVEDYITEKRIRGDWYHHRVVKYRSVKGIPPVGVGSERNQLLTATEEKLKRAVRRGVNQYLSNHAPCQQMWTVQYRPIQGGVLVIVACTLFGPANVDQEIVEELIKRGEV